MGEEFVQSSNVPPLMRRTLLSHPPKGPFHYNSPCLKWVKRRYNKTIYESVFIPTDRLEDFHKGEEQRGHCTFYVKKTKPGRKKEKENDANVANTEVRLTCSAC